ncbi:MAG: calcium-binding protein [Pikeienuella sp.]
MATLTSSNGFTQTNESQIPNGLSVDKITIVDNAYVSFTYSLAETSDLIRGLLSTVSLSVGAGTFTIDGNNISGDGSITIVDLENELPEITTDVSSLTLTNTVTVSEVAPSTAVNLSSGGVIATGGVTLAGGGTGNAPVTAPASLFENAFPPIAVELPGGASFFETKVEVFGTDLFADGIDGTVTELRISFDCPVGFNFDFLGSFTTISGLNLNFSEVFSFLQNSDDFLSEDFQETLLNGDDQILGSFFNDDIAGRSGDDTLEGGRGDDILSGGDGADHLDGGEGFDFITYAASDSRVIVDATAGLGARGDARGDTFTNVEGIIGSRFADHLRGSANGDELRGGAASDRLVGRAGDDTLDGGSGTDMIYGGRGIDVMTGGGGRDRFIFFNERHSGVGEGQRDIITDFSVEDGERIELSRLDADLTQARAQAFSFIGEDEFSAAGQLRFDQSSGTSTIVQADIDGDGFADFEIELTGLIDLTAANFLL